MEAPSTLPHNFHFFPISTSVDILYISRNKRKTRTNNMQNSLSLSLINLFKYNVDIISTWFILLKRPFRIYRNILYRNVFKIIIVNHTFAINYELRTKNTHVLRKIKV